MKLKKTDGHVSNPAGLFVQALKQNWGSEVASNENSQATFRYWYGLARELGYCQGAEVRDSEQWVLLSDSKSTSESKTAEQTVAASPEKEELNALGEPEAKVTQVTQSEVTGLGEDKKANSGVGNKLAGQEVSSARCSIKVVNKEWKNHLEQLDQLGVGINPTVVKVVKSNQKEDVEKAIALLKARKRDGHISNPAGFFVQALKQNWGSEVASNEDAKLPLDIGMAWLENLGIARGKRLEIRSSG